MLLTSQSLTPVDITNTRQSRWQQIPLLNQYRVTMWKR